MRLPRSPFAIALAASGLTLLLAVSLVAWKALAPPDPAARTAARHGAPWQIGLPAPGRSRVFDLDLPGSTLADAQRRWGDVLQLALVDPGTGPLTLEGYLERFEAGGVSGRLLLRFDTRGQAAAVARWREALPRIPQESGSWQHKLNQAARADLAGSTLLGLSYIADAQLNAEMITARFGNPAERIAEGPRLQHWLYPEQGLIVMLDSKGREVLQYVAPADFEQRLVAPLRAAQVQPPLRP